jgi:hypothetical protein
MDFDLRGLLLRVAEEVEIRQVEELAEVERRARRVGAKRRAEELSVIRDILYEDKWFRVATAVYAQVKGDSPRMERRLKSSRRLRGAYTALGLR